MEHLGRFTEPSRTLAVAIGVIMGWGIAPATAQLPEQTQLTFSGDVQDVAVSPDGKTMAYLTGRSGAVKLWVAPVDGGVAREIASHYDIDIDVWSSDGTALLFEAWGDSAVRGGFFLVSPGGGTPRRLADDSGIMNATLSPDGGRLALGEMFGKRIRIINTGTGDTTSFPVAGSFMMLHEIAWSPTGKWIAFHTRAADRETIGTIGPDGAHQTTLVEVTRGYATPHWSPRGDATYYWQAGTLWKVPVDPSAGQRTAEPRPLLAVGDHFDAFSLSADGRRLLYLRRAMRSTMWLLTPEDRSVAHLLGKKQLTPGAAGMRGRPAISPDGRRVAFGARGGVYVMSLDGGVTEKVTSQEGSSPAFSPDGKTLAFVSGTGIMGMTGRKIFTVPVGGGSPRAFDRTEGVRGDVIVWAPGPRILYIRHPHWRTLDPATGEEQAAFPGFGSDSGWLLGAPAYSPDGKRIALRWDRGKSGTRVVSLGDSSRGVLLNVGNGRPIGWSVDGKTVYASDDDQILAIPAAGGQAKSVAMWPLKGTDARCGWRTEGKWTIVCNVDESWSDVWLVENFDPDVR